MTPPGSLPMLPVRSRAFWLDPDLGTDTRALTRKQIEAAGGLVLDRIDLRVDYLVLHDLKRGRPGASPAEVVADAISGRSIATLYLADLHRMLLPLRGEAVALLRRGPAGRDHWAALLPLWTSEAEIDLGDADLAGLDLSGYVFRNCRLTGANLAGTGLDGAELDRVVGLDLRPVGPHWHLRVGRAEGCTFDGLDLRDAVLDGALLNCTFRGADFAGADLSASDPDGCDFSGADCTDANLLYWPTTALNAEAACFRRADLLGARLVEARLCRADFAEAGLDHALLRKADLRGADLTAATLREARLNDANLVGARLRRCDLRGAHLTGAHVDGATFAGAEYDATTHFPEGFDPAAAGLVERPAPVPSSARPVLTGASTPYERLRDGIGAGDETGLLRGLAEAGACVVFAEVGHDGVSGIVAEPGNADRLYCCRLTEEGRHLCGTQNLVLCGRYRSGCCWHLALLVLSLAHAGRLDAATALKWLGRARDQRRRPDRPALAAILARYAEQEPDYRPAESLPEDYYAL